MAVREMIFFLFLFMLHTFLCFCRDFAAGFSGCTLLPLLLETYASVFAIEW